ncbi:hypothetical protein [Bacillus sp. Hm123]|uniref:hypothetical protein n=1 Tax=Bacillus sp. Hm123 TaxID=3450745 RepID=UPI003F43FBF8
MSRKNLYNIEKRKRLVQPRQAQDEPAERLLFNLLDGLTCDLEGLGAAARQHRKAEGAAQRRMDWNDPIEIKETR